MSDTWDQEIMLIEVGTPGLDGDGFTPPEAAQVRADLDELLGRPNISTLESLTNVADSGAVDGQTMVKSGSDWIPGNPNSSLTYVMDSWSTTPRVDNATILTFGPGIKAEELTAAGGKRAHMTLQFPTANATNGIENVAARKDHSHAAQVQQLTELPYQGVLSSGYRTLSPQSFGITGLTAGETYDVTTIVTFDVIAAGLDSVVTPRVSIGAGDLEGYDVKFKGQGKGVTIMQEEVGITNVTSLPILVRVFYKSGPQVEIGAGQILAIAKPRR